MQRRYLLTADDSTFPTDQLLHNRKRVSWNGLPWSC